MVEAKARVKETQRASDSEDSSLYGLLGVNRTASQKEVAHAFRLRAFKLHPDKQAPEKRQEATEEFQALQAAYDVLRDPEKRKLYDETGSVDGICLDDALSRWFGHSVSRVTEQDIHAFEKEYKGSKAEEDDILQFCQRFQWNLSQFFDYIPLSHPEEVERFADILKRLRNQEGPVASSTYLKTLKKSAQRYKKRAAREGLLVLSKETSSLSPDTSLISAIQANKKRREASGFIDTLEKKYASTKVSSRSKKVSKRLEVKKRPSKHSGHSSTA